MSLAQQLEESICAGFAGIIVLSHEHQDAIEELGRLCQDRQWSLACWDIDRGLVPCVDRDGESPVSVSGGDPLAPIQWLRSAPASDLPRIVVLRNYHKFLGSPEVIQSIERQINDGKRTLKYLVILSPVLSIPPELERMFLTIEHDLPSREELVEIARGIATDTGELPEGVDVDRVIDAASGMTRFEAEGAFSLALVRHGRVEPGAVWQLKSKTLLRSGLLTLHRGGETFDQLGGLDSLKAFCLRALRKRPTGSMNCRPLGVLLVGVPGSGKSAFCKALGNETGRPTLVLDVGNLMGSLVGQTEERTRQALKVIDAMQPAVVMIDEVEKAFSGVSSSGASDSGVSSRMFGNLLSWLNDRTSDTFVVGTANDVSRIPPEFGRAERFDGLFFLDIPGEEQKNRIWQQYLQQFGLDPDQRRPDDSQWTGAEIKSCCRLAALLDVPVVQAAINIVPIAVTASESVERLRAWAHRRCLNADKAGVYVRDERPSTSRRRVHRNPSNN